ncbi:uncharacterized protein A1O9_03824 [Exophiala aquamarina CBS 119918]|uniref:Uncharacterized protein n=1 Tax=Exophiala aquamarina CBS 119918 TaxID=1182545 RepID=A0A072PGJ5_9EURO|nr:uncharacterized protein A1O9_03824 [Exophiala aquamarina CBS 119918]KEF58981.1 hypothetical protein A1O9_03824 [Exophiala aquamarina CBS 119918]
MTAQSCVAENRIANRRTRQARSRARRLARMKKTMPEGIRGTKRRKLRDQESLNLEDCSFRCEERGYHLDPDVHIGSDNPHIVDPFSVLDLDTADPYETNTSTPSDYNSSPARPETPDYQYSKCGYANSAMSSEKTIFKVEDVALTDANTDYLAPGFPLIPFTPEQTPFVRMPGSFSNSSDNDDHSISKFLLNDIRIPSPSLYHKSERRSIFGTGKADILEVPVFELAHGQSKPEPDFVTYRNTGLDDVTFAAQNSHDADDVESIAAKQALLRFQFPQPDDSGENEKHIAYERSDQLASGPNHLVQENGEDHSWRMLGASDVLDMPSGFGVNASQDDIRKNTQSQSPNIILESTRHCEDDNLIFPELSVSPCDQTMNVMHWSNNIAVSWNRSTADSSSSGLETEVASTTPPSPYRDLVLAISYPRTCTVSSGGLWYCSGTSKLPMVEYHHKEERKVQRTQGLRPILFPDEQSRLPRTKEYAVVLAKTSEKPEIRSDDLSTPPKSPNDVQPRRSLILNTDEDNESYFTPS